MSVKYLQILSVKIIYIFVDLLCMAELIALVDDIDQLPMWYS